MKEVKRLDRVQAGVLLYIILILATIQEYGLKSELACNNCCYISLQSVINVFLKSVIVKPLLCRTYNFLRVFSQCLELYKGESHEE